MSLRTRHALYVMVILAIVLVCFSGISLYAWHLSRRYFQGSGVVAGQRFLEDGSQYYMYDSVAGHVHRPNVAIDVIWPEHPDGHVMMRTNDLGFREDAATRQPKPAELVRVLVTGDSHIDGVVNNMESFPNQLEELLNAPYSCPVFEVDNGGTGHYGPQNYLGFLRKYAFLEPDVYIVVFYTGNDFMDAVTIASRTDEALRARLKTGRFQRLAYLGRLLLARRICHGGVSQALNSVFFFRHFPGLRETALAISRQQLEEIRDICVAGNTHLLVVLLPTRADIEPAIADKRFNAARRILSIDAADMALNRDMADSLATWLRLNGIHYVDLAPYMEEDAGGDLFWLEDYHLNVRGHRLAAEAVYASGRGVCEAGEPGP